MKIRKTSSYCEFALAALNQHVFDLLYYDQSNLCAKQFNYLPRPTKWARMGSCKIKLIKVSSPIFVYLWSFILCYIFLFIKHILFAVKVKKFSFRKNEVKKNIAYVTCDHSFKTIIKEYNETDMTWIAPPNVLINKKLAESAHIKITNSLSLLCLSEIFWTFIDCVKIHAKIVSKQGAKIGLQSYSLPSWCVMRRVTYKMSPKRIVIAEHHDRWAVLADCYAYSVADSVNKCEINLVQHGLEFESTYEFISKNCCEKGLPYKLRCVTNIHIFNDEQLGIFLRNIINNDNRAKENFKTHYMSNEIILNKINSNKKTILIIGHVICEDFHIMLQQELLLNNDVALYYKPHPTCKASLKAENAMWIFIDDREFYPLVDLVVGYPSTLVFEYSKHGVPSVMHHMKADARNVEKCLEEIAHIINKKN